MRIAIIGGGAAGCFAAANIPRQQGREVVVFERSARPLQKVKVSGGGRCNVTHACFDVPELIGRYPRGKQLLKKTLYRFSPKETIEWFAARGVTLKTEADGRMFPSTDDSQTIIDCLRQEMDRQGVDIRYHHQLSRLERTESGFVLHFSSGGSYAADKALVACGGFPKPEAYDWLQACGHTLQPPVPSLFTFNIPGHPVTKLMGISVPDAVVKIAGTKFREQGPVLITHWGMSGPAVLRLSAWAARELHTRDYHFTILVNWLGDTRDEALQEQIATLRRDNGRQLVSHKNPFGLPARLWEYFTQCAGVPEDMRWGDLTAECRRRLCMHLLQDSYEVKGKTTFKEEFVTCGGIPLSEVNPQTMESRIVPGLYFAGEILDVDGITGGFNFQHAWSSGWIAAQAMVSAGCTANS